MASTPDHGPEDRGHPSPEGRALRCDLAVVGAGFCGLATLAQLFAGWSGGPLRVVWIERGGRFGPGVAYSARSGRRLLNVRAGAMSALPDQPDHFLAFARRAADGSEQPCGQDFLPRSLYGRYLEDCLRQAEAAVAGVASLVRLRGEAMRLRGPDGSGWAGLTLADGTQVSAQRVVLALGNALPARPAWLEGFEPGSDDRLLTNPWDENALESIGPDERVLVLGTGLTAIDSILDLAPRLSRGSILAVSRRGLVPRPHRDLHDLPALPPLDLQPKEQRSVLALLRGLRRRAREQQGRGGDWRQVIDALRPHTQGLWAALPLEQRARFLERLAPYWDAHRHRLPGSAWAALGAHLHTGRVRLLAGRVRALRALPRGLQVDVQRRGALGSERIEVDRLLLANGPETDPARAYGPLVSTALAEGLLRRDPLGLGLESTAEGRALDRAGRVLPWLDLIGPLRRASLWESTAVPELRGQAQRLAERLRSRLDPRDSLVTCRP
jgi:uncharacterized NAD(P)/FAD-binding protein YdhS